MNEHGPTEAGGITRRQSLATLGGLVAAAVGAGAWKSGALGDEPAATAATGGPAAVEAGLVSCVLTPEQTEGPYYLEDAKVRRNIREGKPGTALTLRLGVVDASTCRPIKGAAVDIWHCDAAGAYSGFAEGAGSDSFLRGIQRTDAKGVAVFQSVYPGWYRGRTVHIHVSVHVGGRVVHTGQLYFPEAVTAAVYRRAPYRARASGRTILNANDPVFRNGGRRSMLKLRRTRAGTYVATITMGVSRS